MERGAISEFKPSVPIITDTRNPVKLKLEFLKCHRFPSKIFLGSDFTLCENLKAGFGFFGFFLTV